MAAALTSRKKINKLLKEVRAFLSFFARDLCTVLDSPIFP